MDQFFRDRLKDYPSPIHADAWGRVRAGWSRKSFRARWGLAGGIAAVVVAVIAGYFLLRPARPMVTRPGGAAVEASASRAAGGLAGPATGGKAGSPAMPAAGSKAGSAAMPAAGGTGDAGGAGAVKAADSIKAVNGGAGARHHEGSGHDEGLGQGHEGADQDREGLNRERRDRDHEELDREISGDAGQRGGLPMTGAGRFSRHTVVLPSIVQLSSRASVYAKPLKIPPAGPKSKPGTASHDRTGNLYLDIYGSPDIPTKQFALSYTAGARMTMLFTKHFFFTAGLQYSRAFTNRNLVKEGTANGGVSPYPDHFSNLDLPVLVGYTFGTGRFRGAVTTGAIFNLFSHATGNFGWPWPNRTGPSAYLGLDLSWELNDRFALFAEPYGRCMWSDYFSLFPSQTYTGGALIGIRYNFRSRVGFLRR